MDDATWVAALPKVELHVHLEGAIPPPLLWEFINEAGGDKYVRSYSDLLHKLTYRSFADFINAWIWKSGYLTSLDHFRRIAEAAAKELVRQNVHYCEMFFSPRRFLLQEKDVTMEDIVAAIREGFDCVPAVEIALIIDLVRDFGPDYALRSLESVKPLAQHYRIIGIGIGGSEHECPARDFKKVYKQARDAGFHCTAHAGEAAGAASIRSALHDLQVERIGHGLRAHEDVELVHELAAANVTLEMCPISNFHTYTARADHPYPLSDYLKQGVRVCINSDDPGMFQADLNDNILWLLQHEHGGLSRDDVKRCMHYAIGGAWCDAERKAELSQQLAAY